MQNNTNRGNPNLRATSRKGLQDREGVLCKPRANREAGFTPFPAVSGGFFAAAKAVFDPALSRLDLALSRVFLENRRRTIVLRLAA